MIMGAYMGAADMLTFQPCLGAQRLEHEGSRACLHTGGVQLAMLARHVHTHCAVLVLCACAVKKTRLPAYSSSLSGGGAGAAGVHAAVARVLLQAGTPASLRSPD